MSRDEVASRLQRVTCRLTSKWIRQLVRTAFEWTAELLHDNHHAIKHHAQSSKPQASCVGACRRGGSGDAGVLAVAACAGQAAAALLLPTRLPGGCRSRQGMHTESWCQTNHIVTFSCQIMLLSVCPQQHKDGKGSDSRALQLPDTQASGRHRPELVATNQHPNSAIASSSWRCQLELPYLISLLSLACVYLFDMCCAAVYVMADVRVEHTCHDWLNVRRMRC